MADRADHSDPLWDKRRWYIDRGLVACVVEVGFCSIGLLLGLLTPEEVDSLATLILAVNGTGAALLSAYMAIAEAGSVKKGQVVTEEVIDAPPGGPITTTTTETKKPAGEGE